jgi:hypothetical protein
MEVHHHPNVEKKNFKEYLLEFIMIFLAVTMGFFAENIREHFTEEETLKQNMEMVVNGLKNDTTQINGVIDFNKRKIKNLDTVLSFQGARIVDSSRFAYLIYKTASKNYYFSNDAAFEQMKSSGSIRLIKNKATLDSLYSYNHGNQVIYKNERTLEQWQTAALQAASKFINFQQGFAPGIAYYGNEKINLLIEFFNDEAVVRINLANFYIPQLQAQKKMQQALIGFLEKEYDLEE